MCVSFADSREVENTTIGEKTTCAEFSNKYFVNFKIKIAKICDWFYVVL